MHPVDTYAAAVLEGTIPAGKYHRLSCARHQRDRAREGTPEFPFVFDAAAADRFLRFASRLKHYKGEWAGQYVRLEPFQVFRLGSVFGWRHRDTGMRRFRTGYHEIPRKNGKSLEAAIVALYVTFVDNEPGAEGFCLATKRAQARIVFENCTRLVAKSALKGRLRSLTNNLHDPATASKLEPLGADRDSVDGLNPHLIINDELHAWKTRALLDVMETATGARRQPVNFQITTAGNDPVSPGGDQHDYACKILDQVFTDDTFFAFIAHADDTDDWTLESTWRKANPNYGISIKPEDIAALAHKAILMPAAAAAFQQKRLNRWVNAATPWLSLEGWRRGQSVWPLEALEGEPCWIGIDLSSKIDLTAVVAVFPPTEARPCERWIAWCLTPADTLLERARRDRAPYDEWVQAGYLRTCPGNRIDQDAVRDFVREAGRHFDVQQVGVDPWQAGNLVKDLSEDQFDVIEIPQTFQQMSLVCKEFEADVLDGLVDAGENPLVQWAASNVVVQRDSKDNIFPVKRRSRGRIDPIVAGLMGRKLARLDTTPVAADDPELIVA